MHPHRGSSRTVPMLCHERAKGSEPSMSPSLRRIGAALGVAGALAAAAIGCGSSTEGTASATQQGSQQQTQPSGAPGQGQGGPDLSALAAKLGVSESKLQSAMQAARPTQGSSPHDMAASLAKALGVTEADVQAAMEATRPSGAGQPPRSGQTQDQTS